MTFSPAAHKENRVPTKLLVGSSLSMREFFRHSRSSFLFLEDDAVVIRSLGLGYPIVTGCLCFSLLTQQVFPLTFCVACHVNTCVIDLHDSYLKSVSWTVTRVPTGVRVAVQEGQPGRPGNGVRTFLSGLFYTGHSVENWNRGFRAQFCVSSIDRQISRCRILILS